MDTLSAMIRGEMNRDNPLMVFDWNKAARRIIETKAKEARAGLASDWEWTGGTIFEDGHPVPQEDTYTYLASTWATPELELDGEVEDCFIMKVESPSWDSDTYWPQSALDILNAKA